MSDGTTTWSYEYNADGLRTKRTNGTTTYEFIYNGSTLVQMTVGDDTLYFGTGTVTYDGVVYYYVTNLQGDVIAILDATGTAVVTYSYDAWGNILTTSGTMADTLGAINPLRYRGYVYDRETSLYYLQSRYYNPEVGRFINADALVSTGQGLLGNNMFAYCLNNPVMNIDRFGFFSDYYPTDYPGQVGKDFGMWLYEALTSDENDSDDESSLNEKLQKTAKSIAHNLEISRGIGLGLYGGLSACRLLGVDLGMYYDVLHISYSHGELTVQDYAYRGCEATIFFYTAGFSEGQYRNYSDMPCEPVQVETNESTAWTIFSIGGYFFGGGNIVVSFDIEAFLADVGEIFFGGGQ